MNDLLSGLWLSLKISGCVVGVLFCVWFTWAILLAWVDMRRQRQRKEKQDREVLYVCKKCDQYKYQKEFNSN